MNPFKSLSTYQNGRTLSSILDAREGHHRGMKPAYAAEGTCRAQGSTSFWCGEPGVQLNRGVPQDHRLSRPIQGSTYTKFAVAGHLARPSTDGGQQCGRAV